MLWQVAWQSCMAAPTLKLNGATVSVYIRRIRVAVKWWEIISLSKQKFMKKWYWVLESETYKCVFSIQSPILCPPPPPCHYLQYCFLHFVEYFNNNYCLCLLTMYFFLPFRWVSQQKNGLTKVKISNDYFSHEYHCTASCCQGWLLWVMAIN